ncbi:MAG: hypothetical protein NWE83_14020 [Candidatus Bathyarchaeota archaeon]|nr:hypothetical protein [Candidatus Bathyarchaeota archaeon]
MDDMLDTAAILDEMGARVGHSIPPETWPQIIDAITDNANKAAE